MSDPASKTYVSFSDRVKAMPSAIDRCPNPIMYPLTTVEWLIQRLASRLIPATRTVIHSEAANYRARAFSPNIARDNSMLGDMHWHPLADTEGSQGLSMLRRMTLDIPDDHPARAKFEIISGWLTSANSLKQLHRFMDGRQPPMLRAPSMWSDIWYPQVNPESSDELCYEWYLRRAFIRFLHFPGMAKLADFDWDGEFVLPDLKLLHGWEGMYEVGRGLLEREHAMVSVWDGDRYGLNPRDRLMHRMKWIQPTRDIIQAVLEEVVEVAYEVPEGQVSRAAEMGKIGEEFRGAADPASDELRNELFLNNVLKNSITLADNMIEAYNDMMVDYPFERLIMDLLDKEDTFERRLTVEHVEDRLINKQINFWDEEAVTTVPNRIYSTVDLDNMTRQTRGQRFEKLMYSILADISLMNRQRRNFRLLREWVDHRPWARIIQLYDTSQPENNWIQNAIAQFTDKVRIPQEMMPFGYRGLPSTYAHLSDRLFGITPFNYSAILDANKQFAPCTICNVPFVAGSTFESTVMQLRCQPHHRFHLQCIFDYWDLPGRYTHTCPTCGQHPRMNHELVNLEPVEGYEHTFVHNNWGWLQGVHPGTPGFHYNLPEPDDEFDPNVVIPRDRRNWYWRKENMYAAAVEEAVLTWNSDGIQPGHTRTPARKNTSREVNQMARHVSDGWLAREGNWELVANLEDEVAQAVAAGSDGERKWSGARFMPLEEQSFLRQRRRTRDRKKRDAMKRAGRGLAGLRRRS